MAIENMNNQFLGGKQVSVQYAFKKDGKGERHGTTAERLLAAQAKKTSGGFFGCKWEPEAARPTAAESHSRLGDCSFSSVCRQLTRSNDASVRPSSSAAGRRAGTGSPRPAGRFHAGERDRCSGWCSPTSARRARCSGIPAVSGVRAVLRSVRRKRISAAGPVPAAGAGAAAVRRPTAVWRPARWTGRTGRTGPAAAPAAADADGLLAASAWRVVDVIDGQ
jgi:hypothetical protein